MPVHVVKDEPAVAGEQPQPKAKSETSPIFWLVLGVVGGAVAMHFTARKMQEYAGGMYSRRAQLQSRLGLMPASQMQAVPIDVSEDDEDEPRGWFG